jgi:DNA-binding MarR family transcriptional regulator
MGEHLKKRLMQSRFESPYQEAFLNLLIAAAHLREHAQGAFQPLDITNAQYNVLRILKGAHPEGYPRCEIQRRLIERAPDLTRMIDRLVRAGLVERGQSENDRRQSITSITRKGLDLLERTKPALGQVHRTLSDRLTRAEAEELSRLCERLYGTD